MGNEMNERRPFCFLCQVPWCSEKNQGLFFSFSLVSQHHVTSEADVVSWLKRLQNICFALSFCLCQTGQQQGKISALESSVGSVVLGHLLEAEILKSTHFKTSSAYRMPENIPEGSDWLHDKGLFGQEIKVVFYMDAKHLDIWRQLFGILWAT